LTLAGWTFRDDRAALNSRSSADIPKRLRGFEWRTTERRNDRTTETRLKRETQTAADKTGTAAETTEDQSSQHLELTFILLLTATSLFPKLCIRTGAVDMRSLLQLALPALIGCASSRITAPNLGPPATTGTITSTDPQLGFLVERSPGTTGPARLYFRVDAQTEIRVGASEGRVVDLTTGKTVAVWATAALSDSISPHVVARAVLVYR
jgi:hypothetical protein